MAGGPSRCSLEIESEAVVVDNVAKLRGGLVLEETGTDTDDTVLEVPRCRLGDVARVP